MNTNFYSIAERDPLPDNARPEMLAIERGRIVLTRNPADQSANLLLRDSVMPAWPKGLDPA